MLSCFIDFPVIFGTHSCTQLDNLNVSRKKGEVKLCIERDGSMFVLFLWKFATKKEKKKRQKECQQLPLLISLFLTKSCLFVAGKYVCSLNQVKEKNVLRQICFHSKRCELT